MDFILDNGEATYQINAYHNQQIEVNNHTYAYPIVVMPEYLKVPWGPKDFENLAVEHFSILLSYKPEVVLLGTGKILRFPKAELYQILTKERIGIEIMHTAAACRTYKILMAEGRKVAAALLC